jgi:hypothetical protein
MPFCEGVLDAADGLIAHSRYVLERAAPLRPSLPAALVPMGVPLPPPIPRGAARARLGLPSDALILASFGHINPYKRLDAALRAVRALRAEHPALRYLLVGSVSPSFDVRAAIARAGLDDVVTATGYVDRRSFEDYVAAADICLNLRHPTAGETSASLLRLLGAGKPTLVTASGSFAELPPGVAAQVDLGAGEGDLILAYCRLLTARPEVATALGTNARAFVATEHTLDGAAAGYIRFLAARYSWGEMPPLRDRPLWEPATTDERRPTTDDRRLTTDERPTTNDQRRSANEDRLPIADRRLPTADQVNAEQSATDDLQSAIAESLAGLGATEDDRPLLEGAARALAELGIIPIPLENPTSRADG